MTYSIQDFYAAREGGKPYAKGMAPFDTEHMYVFRFLAKRFVKDLPVGLWGPFVNGVSGFLSVDVPEYSVHGITLAKIPAGSIVNVYSGELFSWGKDVLTFDSSWFIDVVVSPGVDVGNVWTTPDAWVAHIKSVLDSWQGVPSEVSIVGVIPMPLYLDQTVHMTAEQVSKYESVIEYWKKRPSIRVVRACSEEESVRAGIEGGIKCPHVTSTDFGQRAWQSGFVGADGYGLVQGFFDDLGTMKPVKMLAGSGIVKAPPSDKPTTPPPAPSVAKATSPNAVMGLFAVLGFFAAQKYFER